MVSNKYVCGENMKKTKDYKPSRSLRVITQNKKLISSVIIIAYILIIIAVFFICNKSLEDTNYVAEIISGIFVVAGLVVSVLQYTASCVENSILRDQEKKIKAAEMANQFQAEIIPLLNTLTRAYKESGLDKSVLNTIENAEMVMFNKEEVDGIIKEAKCDVGRAFTGLCVGHLIYNGKVKIPDKESVNAKFEISPEDKTSAEREISQCINELSNKLEYFGICFNSGIADEETVYQSLHHVFFECVHMLYIFIFSQNETESDRLYSNVSSLYLKWKERHINLVNQEKEELLNMKKDVQRKIVVKAKK